MKNLAKYIIGVALFLLASNIALSQPVILSITTDSVICNGGATGQINITITGGTPPYVYYWFKFPSFHGDTTNSLTHTFANLSAGNFSSIGVKDNIGFEVDTSNIFVGQPKKLTVSIIPTSPASVCSGIGLPLTATPNGGNGGNTHAWYGTGTLADSLNNKHIYNPTFTYRGSASLTLTDTVKDYKGCTAFKDISINVNQGPSTSVLSASGLTTICNGSSTTLKVTITGGASLYTVVLSDGTTVNGYTSGNDISVSPTTTTTYTITSVTDANGCLSKGLSGSVTVTVNALPTITLGANPSVCMGSTSANLTYSATTGVPDQYSITFDAAAHAAGFVDVTNVALPGSPIIITVPGAAAAATYNGTLTVRKSTTGCSSTGYSITVTVNALPTITLGANPSVCRGSTSANLTYSATTGVPDQYSITFDAAAHTAGFVDVTNVALPGSPIIITVPGAAAAATYNGTLTVRKSTTGCSSSGYSISVTVNALPTITLGANPSVCMGSTSANLTYSATTGSPDQYSITFDAAAHTAGFADVTNVALPGSPIIITVPGAAAATTYNGTLTVRKSTTGCSSSGYSISVTVNALPTITLGANPSVCRGSTSANLTYSATTGVPDQYSITFDAAAHAAGFVDVTNVALPGSPIIITVPGAAAAATYNGTLTVRKSTTGCSSSGYSISVTVNALPTITLGANPSVCRGSTSANLTYSATTGSPDQYSITFDAAAHTAGFVDVTNVALPGSPIIITVPGAAAAATYNGTLTVRNSAAGCSSSGYSISVTVNALPTITLGANPSVCSGSTSANLTYSATTGSPDQYSITFDAAAHTAGFVDVTNVALPGSPIIITVPGAAAAATYNGTLTVRNSAAGCSSSGYSISVTVNALPTITLGANPSVCSGSTSANLTYSATTGSPDQYSITFDAAAHTAGFVDVTNVALPGSPIIITVPGAAAAATYNGTLTVRKSITGCSSTGYSITVTVNALPTITLGANPSVCSGSTSANLTYSATTGSPDQYSITFNAAAHAAGFVDVTNVALPGSPIIITVPGAAAATYNGTLTVRKSTTGCSSTGSNITVTIVALPTITLGANPSVCSGSTSANLTYSVTTGSPDQYSITFDAAAHAAGFVDVTNVALPTSPIIITVPGAAAAATYNGTLTVRNSTAGCTSPGYSITVTVNALPTITLGANPSVCSGSTSANLTYSATTGVPDQYSITFDAAAHAAGFVDVTNVALPTSPIIITVPGAAAAATYNGTLTVRKSTTGCSSTGSNITVTIVALPTITLGANPSVCSGSTSANLTYSATTGVPDQYSITFDAAAHTAGFVDVTNVALPGSPIIITVPGAAAAATYNGTLTVRNSAAGCSSSGYSISVTVNALPTITLGANPSVCSGSTSANLTYSATTGSPDQYSITFDAAAHTAGFVDVTNVALLGSPIIITVPGAAAAATYNGTLTVRNSAAGCSSSGYSISVTVNPLPNTSYTVSDTTICFLDSATITVSGSENGTSYVMKKVLGNSPVGDTVIGTGNSISLIIPNASIPLGVSKYYVEATSAAGCVSQLINQATVTKRTAVTETVNHSNVICNGDSSGKILPSGHGGTTPYFFSTNGSNGSFIYPNNKNILEKAGQYLVVARDNNSCKSTVDTVNITEPAPITYTLSSVPSSCSGTDDGKIIIQNASGGTPGYKYSIYGDDPSEYGLKDTFPNLPPDTYEVIVKDSKGCKSGIDTVTLSEANQINITFSVNNPPKEICYGDSGTITLSATGGSENFEYSMSTTPGVPGVYQPTGNFYLAGPTDYYGFVHDITNNCTALANNGNPISLNTDPRINIFINEIDSVSPCYDSHNGRIWLKSASGGKGGYSYWLDGINYGSQKNFPGLAAGSHIIKVVDSHSCSQDSTVSIGAPPPIVIDSVTKKNLNCYNVLTGEIHVYAHRGLGSTLQYALNGGSFSTTHDFTGLDGGNYEIHIKDSIGCSKDTTPIKLSEPLQFVIKSASATPITCTGLTDGKVTAVATGGTKPYKFTLFPGGVIFNNTGTFSNLSKGKYVIEMTDKNNCDTLSTDSLEVIEPGLIVIDSFPHKDIVCGGSPTGQIHVYAHGGTNPRAYSLTPGSYANNSGIFNGLPANSYNISVTDSNHCTAATAGPVAIIQPVPLSFSSFTITNLTCNQSGDGIINAFATGGTGSLTYTLNYSGIPQATGNFPSLQANQHDTVYVLDSLKCQIDSAFKITQPNPITIKSAVATSVSCPGMSDGTITVSAIGGNAPLTYKISPAAQPQNNNGSFSQLPRKIYSYNYRCQKLSFGYYRYANRCQYPAIGYFYRLYQSYMYRRFYRANLYPHTGRAWAFPIQHTWQFSCKLWYRFNIQ